MKSILRLGVFALFLVFTITSVIPWSFRYVALSALLIVWALIGAITLVRKKESKNKYKQIRIILRGFGSILLIAFALLPAFAFPQYHMIATTGDLEVATVLYTYTDSKRVETYTNTGEPRKLNVQFWYPKNSKEDYPLLVFSHGGLGIRTSNESLYNELASHGYVVCSIDHTYHSLFTTDVDGNRISADSGYMKECSKEDAKKDKQQSYEYYQKWMELRTGDINFVIDHILSEAQNSKGDIAYQKIDISKIGVMGHSLGGAAVLGIGRERKDVGAVMALEAPFLCDIQGVEADEFVFEDEPYPIPLLSIYSDSSWGHLSEWAQYEENYAILSDSDPNTHDVYLKGTGHFSLTDLALTSPLFTCIFNGQLPQMDTEVCLKRINQLTLDFFNCYLKGKGEFIAEREY
jgi:dienelactone hydrolase